MTGTVICHHGIKGQKWGIRRFENEDGTLTEEGKKRYYKNGKDAEGGLTKEGAKRYKTAKTTKPSSDDYVKTHTTKVNEFSDSDLQKAISRLKMEKEFKELSATPADKTKQELGKQVKDYRDTVIKGVVGAAATATVAALATPQGREKLVSGAKKGAKLVKSIYSKMFGSKISDEASGEMWEAFAEWSD